MLRISIEAAAFRGAIRYRCATIVYTVMVINGRWHLKFVCNFKVIHTHVYTVYLILFVRTHHIHSENHVKYTHIHINTFRVYIACA